MSEQALCTVCGEPMAPEESMFKFHGSLGPCPKPPLKRIRVGSHVQKKSGMKFVGTVLAIYNVPHEERQWCVVILDKNEASDHLQHLYPLELFELVE